MTHLPPLQQWHNDVTFEFLEVYSKERCIWDPKHPDHKNRLELNKAWDRIQASMRLEHSVADLKRKKESLMTTFRIHVRRKRRNPNYVPAWFCFQAIESFLGDIYFGDGEESFTKPDSNVDVSSYFEKRRPQMQKLRTNVNHSTPSPNRIQIKREIQSPVTYTTAINDMDECELYGQLLAKKLRRLDQHERDIAMHEIDNIMFTAKINQDRHYESQSQMKNRSPVFVDPLDKQNDEYCEAEYLEDPMQEE